MKIGEMEYTEILVTDDEGYLLASITDDSVIRSKDCEIICIPAKSKKAETCELVEELKKREGVETHIARPCEDMTVKANGPATVLVVTD